MLKLYNLTQSSHPETSNEQKHYILSRTRLSPRDRKVRKKISNAKTISRKLCKTLPLAQIRTMTSGIKLILHFPLEKLIREWNPFSGSRIGMASKGRRRRKRINKSKTK